ncbi:hypothetical protein Tco_0548636 [Tanacetum coccineum]
MSTTRSNMSTLPVHHSTFFNPLKGTKRLQVHMPMDDLLQAILRYYDRRNLRLNRIKSYMIGQDSSVHVMVRVYLLADKGETLFKRLPPIKTETIDNGKEDDDVSPEQGQYCCVRLITAVKEAVLRLVKIRDKERRTLQCSVKKLQEVKGTKFYKNRSYLAEAIRLDSFKKKRSYPLSAGGIQTNVEMIAFWDGKMNEGLL